MEDRLPGTIIPTPQDWGPKWQACKFSHPCAKIHDNWLSGTKQLKWIAMRLRPVVRNYFEKENIEVKFRNLFLVLMALLCLPVIAISQDKMAPKTTAKIGRAHV